MMITVPSNNLRSETQKRVQAASTARKQETKKSFNFKWLLFPVACVVVSEIACVLGTLSLLVY